MRKDDDGEEAAEEYRLDRDVVGFGVACECIARSALSGERKCELEEEEEEVERYVYGSTIESHDIADGGGRNDPEGITVSHAGKSERYDDAPKVERLCCNGKGNGRECIDHDGDGPATLLVVEGRVGP